VQRTGFSDLHAWAATRRRRSAYAAEGRRAGGDGDDTYFVNNISSAMLENAWC
jgi:hypothetical protein